MERKPWMFVIGSEDKGIRLVVTHDHVVTRFVFLDEVVLKQKRFGFAVYNRDIHVRNLTN